jgi:hypothetical protein
MFILWSEMLSAARVQERFYAETMNAEYLYPTVEQE